jgi:toxin ParE1/3/4
VPNLVILPFAEAQMADALEYTLVTFGEAKYREYLDLIEVALRALAADPSSGRKRADFHADAWTYHIGLPGRRARHMFLYRVRADVEVGRFLHDAMDLRRHWPKGWPGR